MDASIPFQDGLSLGQTLDVTKQSFKHGPLVVPDDVKSRNVRVNLTTAQFAIVNSISDVCDILQVPLAYALKVESNLIRDDVVTACLKETEKPNTMCTIFRVHFLQQKQYLPESVRLNLDALHDPQDEDQPQAASDDVKEGSADQPQTTSDDVKEGSADQPQTTSDDVKEGSADQPQTTSDDVKEGSADQPQTTSDDVKEGSADQPQTTSDDVKEGSKSDAKKFAATHWVKAMELGNELIVICRISVSDKAEFSSIYRKLSEKLGGYRGLLETEQINALEEFAKKIDKKLKKEVYREIIKLKIEYCMYSDLQQSPANLTDMVNVIKEFLRKCKAWTDLYKQTGPHEFNKGPMTWKVGTDMPEERGTVDKVKDFLNIGTPVDTPQFFGVQYYTSEAEEELDSIEIVASESDCVHYMRAIIESLENEDIEISSFNMVQYPETCQSKLHSLHKLFLNNMKAIEKLQKFLAYDYCIADDLVQEGKTLLKASYLTQVNMADAIKRLDFVTVPTDEELKSLLESVATKPVDLYIETVTSKLPPGPDLDLLLIGKTGHGKSSTGNSILGQEKFEASAQSESVTTSCSVGWTQVDGRTIKVVDTPGVCDTRSDADKSSIDVAIHAISEAITHCPDGFHALLLVIRFGQRMTDEEKKAIGLLKCIFGDDIIKEHCVCVITHGDNFKTEIKGKKTFEAWCKGESGFLKHIFEECQYRCVLFDNKSDDLKELKRQVITLVSRIDKLNSRGTRYTNALFEFAMNERKRVMHEENAPEVDENVMRDVQLVLNHLDGMIKGSENAKSFETELENLKCTVDNLKNQVDSLKGTRMDSLVDTIFSLAEAVHARIDAMKKPSPSDSSATGTSECATLETSPQNTQQSEVKESFNTVLKPHQETLQEVQKEMEPKANVVNEIVAKKVEDKVKAEKNCFPGASWVTLKDGSHKSMRDLEVGEEILVRNGHGQFVYEKVYMFGHCDVKTISDYFVFETKHQRVNVSHDHMVYCLRNGLEGCLPARLIREGDELIMHSCQGVDREPILQISSEEQMGLFAPFTNSGSLVVDGALMSCYVDVLPSAQAHKLLKPMRKLYQISPAALKFINGSIRGNVMPLWANIFLKCKKLF